MLFAHLTASLVVMPPIFAPPAQILQSIFTMGPAMSLALVPTALLLIALMALAKNVVRHVNIALTQQSVKAVWPIIILSIALAAQLAPMVL